jgi:hypothetical protein
MALDGCDFLKTASLLAVRLEDETRNVKLVAIQLILQADPNELMRRGKRQSEKKIGSGEAEYSSRDPNSQDKSEQNRECEPTSPGQ